LGIFSVIDINNLGSRGIVGSRAYFWIVSRPQSQQAGAGRSAEI